MKIYDFFEREIIKYKFLAKPFIILAFIYCLGIVSIIRANFNYIDDLGRVFDGYRGWMNWSRYISEGLSVLIHTDSRLMDISPLPQILACLILAFASVILIYVFTEKEQISKWNILAVLPLGLSPYFLECLSYKFDSPYMALSVLASIFPFLFVKYSEKIYFAMSIAGCLVMCMTYQASSGIYVLVTLFLAAKKLNKDKPYFRFIAVSALSYVISLVVFRIALMRKLNDYATTDTAGVSDLIPTVCNNIQTYFNLIYSDFNRVWLVLIALLAFAFIYTFVKVTSLKIYESLLLAFMLLVFGSVLSYGGYILLKHPLFAPRGMYGIGVLLAIISVNITAISKNNFIKIVCILLSWCFFVFSFSYGNALAEQKRYTDFRVNMLITDLNKLQPQNNMDMLMQLDGNIGKSPALTRRIDKRYPIIKRLVPSTLGADWVWNQYYLYNYFNLPHIKQHFDTKKQDFKKFNLPVIVNSRYHDIMANDKYILVQLK